MEWVNQVLGRYATSICKQKKWEDYLPNFEINYDSANHVAGPFMPIYDFQRRSLVGGIGL